MEGDLLLTFDTKNMITEGEKLRILIAEDNALNQQLLKTLITMKGWKATVVSNGDEAIKQCTAKPFDLIFMDINMPFCDGLEATRALRNLGITTPIVAVSAFCNPEYKTLSKQAGMNGFIAKPFNRQEIYSTVSRFCKAPCFLSDTA